MILSVLSHVWQNMSGRAGERAGGRHGGGGGAMAVDEVVGTSP